MTEGSQRTESYYRTEFLERALSCESCSRLTDRLRLQISKSIAKITSALTRRLPGKLSTARRLPK
ncbi:hypothetical protein YC2023_061363 [Brassica napus]